MTDRQPTPGTHENFVDAITSPAASTTLSGEPWRSALQQAADLADSRSQELMDRWTSDLGATTATQAAGAASYIIAELHGDILALLIKCERQTPPPSTHLRGYQERVATAHHALFHDDPTDIEERNARAFEEAIETAQAFGMTRDEAVALVDYTFSRPVGDPAKEIGSKILTAFSLGVVAGIDVMAAAEADLENLERPETIARIRAKRSTRHGRGPLPGLDPALATTEGSTDA